MTEEVREALMRLTMCAREECAICKYKDECGFDFQFETATAAMNIILEALTERPKGKWIDNYSARNEEGFWRCSVCGREISLYNSTEKERTEKYPYCHCGADMRGGDEH